MQVTVYVSPHAIGRMMHATFECGITRRLPELCREHGISSASFYKWHSKFGGMDAALMSRRKELEEENRRLKKMYTEERLKAEIIQEAMAKKW